MKKDWPTCPECQFEIDPKHPYHQRDCSKGANRPSLEGFLAYAKQKGISIEYLSPERKQKYYHDYVKSLSV